MTNAPIVLLATDGASTRAVFHALRRDLGPVSVVLEQRGSRAELLKRRARRYGRLSVAGQVAFMAVVQPVLARQASDRIRAIRDQYGLDESPITGDVTHVPSVNSPAAREALTRLAPAVVVVNGTRIIGKETLAVIRCPIINMHAGITPRFRGVHGGYWALAEGRPDLVGTTVHLVDAGIDTGTILAQATFTPSAEDSFATYPYLHTAAGLPLLLEAVRKAREGTLRPQPERADLDSKLWVHPTLWGYLRRRCAQGVK